MAKKTYKDRLNIPIEGNNTLNFFTESGTHVASGYTRVVIGGRGPYVEFGPDHIVEESFYIPEDQEYRKKDRRVYYVEARSNDEACVKLYFQKRTVAYADYKIGMFYLSPFELYTNGGERMID